MAFVMIVVIGLAIYIFSRMESAQSGELLMWREYAMLQLQAQGVPLLM